MSYRNQFLIINITFGVVFIVLAALVWPWVNKQQGEYAAHAITARKQLAEKQAQQENLRKAQRSLKILDGKTLKVSQLLPEEGNIVGELATLEVWAESLGLGFKVGISGRVEDAKRGETKSDIAIVPLRITLLGKTSQVLSFLRLLEQSSLPFVTENLAIGVDAASKVGGVVAGLDGVVYIKR